MILIGLHLALASNPVVLWGAIALLVPLVVRLWRSLDRLPVARDLRLRPERGKPES